MKKIKERLHKHRALWDRLGVFVSGLCIIHCLSLPILLAFFPQIKKKFFPKEDFTHMILLAFILGFAGAAFLSGYHVHGEKKPVIFMSIGVLIVIFATYFAHNLLGHYWEPVLAIIGSLFLIYAHILNHKHCKICNHDSCHSSKNNSFN
ncbi:MAG: MerC domain-containing protein [Bdellovibrio sp.]|nr:MAG: MerC domain-containing protein [Bdellovibrio sp.]